MKQTAVEWLENELKKLPFVNVIDVFEQAKEMEREQMASNYSQQHISFYDIDRAARQFYKQNIDYSNIPREHYEWEIQELMSDFCYKWYREQLKQK